MFNEKMQAFNYNSSVYEFPNPCGVKYFSKILALDVFKVVSNVCGETRTQKTLCQINDVRRILALATVLTISYRRICRLQKNVAHLFSMPLQLADNNCCY